jgi:hypothetical protein
MAVVRPVPGAIENALEQTSSERLRNPTFICRLSLRRLAARIDAQKRSRLIEPAPPFGE